MPGKFKNAFPYQEDVMSLPVENLDIASAWYAEHFGLVEVQRLEKPYPTVVMERDGVQIGFALSGRDPSQDGAAILVTEIESIKKKFKSKNTPISNERIDERDGQKFNVFFVVAPDGLCYYIHEPLQSESA